MDSAKLDFEHGNENEHREAHKDGKYRASRIGLLPVHPENDRPQENSFEPAKGEKIDPDQQIRRIEGGGKNEDAGG